MKTICFGLVASFLMGWASIAQAGCHDTGVSHGCSVGCIPHWQVYDDATGIMYDSLAHCMTSTCCSCVQCLCGATDTGGPCNGCGHQALELAGNCFSDASCNSTCNPVPELTESGGMALYVVIVLTAMLFGGMGQRRRKIA